MIKSRRDKERTRTFRFPPSFLVPPLPLPSLLRQPSAGSSCMSNSHSLGTTERHEPRIGNGDASSPQLDPPDCVQPTQKLYPPRPALEPESELSCGKREAKTVLSDISRHLTTFHFELPKCLRWIPDNWTLSKWTTAIRCAVSEWASLLLLIINPSARAMGQVRAYVLYSSLYLWLSKGCIFDSGRYVDLA